MINTDQKVLDVFEEQYDEGCGNQYFAYWMADEPWQEDQDDFTPGWYIDHGFKWVTTIEDIEERKKNGESIDWRYHDTKTKEDSGHGMVEWTDEPDPEDDDFDWMLDEIGGYYIKKIKDYEVRVDGSTCTTAMVFITISKGDEILINTYDANYSKYGNIEGIFAECLNTGLEKGELTEEQYEFLVKNI